MAVNGFRYEETLILLEAGCNVFAKNSDNKIPRKVTNGNIVLNKLLKNFEEEYLKKIYFITNSNNSNTNLLNKTGDLIKTTENTVNNNENNLPIKGRNMNNNNNNNLTTLDDCSNIEENFSNLKINKINHNKEINTYFQNEENNKSNPMTENIFNTSTNEISANLQIKKINNLIVSKDGIEHRRKDLSELSIINNNHNFSNSNFYNNDNKSLADYSKNFAVINSSKHSNPRNIAHPSNINISTQINNKIYNNNNNSKGEEYQMKEINIFNNITNKINIHESKKDTKFEENIEQSSPNAYFPVNKNSKSFSINTNVGFYYNIKNNDEISDRKNLKKESSSNNLIKPKESQNNLSSGVMNTNNNNDFNNSKLNNFSTNNVCDLSNINSTLNLIEPLPNNINNNQSPHKNNINYLNNMIGLDDLTANNIFLRKKNHTNLKENRIFTFDSFDKNNNIDLTRNSCENLLNHNKDFGRIINRNSLYASDVRNSVNKNPRKINLHFHKEIILNNDNNMSEKFESLMNLKFCFSYNHYEKSEFISILNSIFEKLDIEREENVYILSDLSSFIFSSSNLDFISVLENFIKRLENLELYTSTKIKEKNFLLAILEKEIYNNLFIMKKTEDAIKKYRKKYYQSSKKQIKSIKIPQCKGDKFSNHEVNFNGDLFVNHLINYSSSNNYIINNNMDKKDRGNSYLINIANAYNNKKLKAEKINNNKEPELDKDNVNITNYSFCSHPQNESFANVKESLNINVSSQKNTLTRNIINFNPKDYSSNYTNKEKINKFLENSLQKNFDFKSIDNEQKGILNTQQNKDFIHDNNILDQFPSNQNLFENDQEDTESKEDCNVPYTGNFEDEDEEEQEDAEEINFLDDDYDYYNENEILPLMNNNNNHNSNNNNYFYNGSNNKLSNINNNKIKSILVNSSKNGENHIHKNIIEHNKIVDSIDDKISNMNYKNIKESNTRNNYTNCINSNLNKINNNENNNDNCNRISLDHSATEADNKSDFLVDIETIRKKFFVDDAKIRSFHENISKDGQKQAHLNKDILNIKEKNNNKKNENFDADNNCPNTLNNESKKNLPIKNNEVIKIKNENLEESLEKDLKNFNLASPQLVSQNLFENILNKNSPNYPVNKIYSNVNNYKHYQIKAAKNSHYNYNNSNNKNALNSNLKNSALNKFNHPENYFNKSFLNKKNNSNSCSNNNSNYSQTQKGFQVSNKVANNFNLASNKLAKSEVNSGNNNSYVPQSNVNANTFKLSLSNSNASQSNSSSNFKYANININNANISKKALTSCNSNSNISTANSHMHNTINKYINVLNINKSQKLIGFNSNNTSNIQNNSSNNTNTNTNVSGNNYNINNNKNISSKRYRSVNSKNNYYTSNISKNNNCKENKIKAICSINTNSCHNMTNHPNKGLIVKTSEVLDTVKYFEKSDKKIIEEKHKCNKHKRHINAKEEKVQFSEDERNIIINDITKKIENEKVLKKQITHSKSINNSSSKSCNKDKPHVNNLFNLNKHLKDIDNTLLNKTNEHNMSDSIEEKDNTGKLLNEKSLNINENKNIQNLRDLNFNVSNIKSKIYNFDSDEDIKATTERENRQDENQNRLKISKQVINDLNLNNNKIVNIRIQANDEILNDSNCKINKQANTQMNSKELDKSEKIMSPSFSLIHKNPNANSHTSLRNIHNSHDNNNNFYESSKNYNAILGNIDSNYRSNNDLIRKTSGKDKDFKLNPMEQDNINENYNNNNINNKLELLDQENKACDYNNYNSANIQSLKNNQSETVLGSEKSILLSETLNNNSSFRFKYVHNLSEIKNANNHFNNSNVNNLSNVTNFKNINHDASENPNKSDKKKSDAKKDKADTYEQLNKVSDIDQLLQIEKQNIKDLIKNKNAINYEQFIHIHPNNTNVTTITDNNCMEAHYSKNNSNDPNKNNINSKLSNQSITNAGNQHESSDNFYYDLDSKNTLSRRNIKERNFENLKEQIFENKKKSLDMIKKNMEKINSNPSYQNYSKKPPSINNNSNNVNNINSSINNNNFSYNYNNPNIIKKTITKISDVNVNKIKKINYYSNNEGTLNLNSRIIENDNESCNLVDSFRSNMKNEDHLHSKNSPFFIKNKNEALFKNSNYYNNPNNPNNLNNVHGFNYIPNPHENIFENEYFTAMAPKRIDSSLFDFDI